MLITPINSINNSQKVQTFKSSIRLPANKNVAKNMLETTLLAAAAYGMSQLVVNKGVNSGEEKTPFLETKTGEKIVSIKLDSNGKEEFRTKIKPSKIAGEYNITKIFPNGEKKILSSATVNKSGHFDIQKKFLSPSGLQTIYKRTGKGDDYSLNYVITDSAGNVQLDFSRSFKKIDNDTTESTVKGVKYINTFNILGVESVNQDNPNDKNFYIYNWQFEDNMKKLPAEIFYCLQKNKIRILEEDYENENNACVQGHLLKLSTDLRNDFFVFAHEVGHVKSYEIGDLAKDKDLQEVFEQERQEAFKNMGEVLKKEADYFLTHPYRLDEVIAETYAILSGLDHNNVESILGMRTNILMQYFPKTITYIANQFYPQNMC